MAGEFWIPNFWALWADDFWVGEGSGGPGPGPGGPSLPGWVLAQLQYPVVEIELPQETPPP